MLRPPRPAVLATLVAVLAAAMLAGCGGSPRHHASPGITGRPDVMSAYDDTVRVETSTACGAGRAGEGLTDGRFVLTTASVVAGARGATVTNRQGQQVPARLVTVDPEADVAWLYAPGLPSRPTSPAQAGDHVAPAYVFTVGGRTVSVLRALSLERTTRTGTDVYRSHAVTRQVYVLHLDHPSTADVTGAPVLDDDGHLLGLALTGGVGATEVVALAGDAVARSPATDALRHFTDPATASAPVTRCVS
ncbi:MAG: trypsin-like peptidase domain-containing protein [Frankiaceae bacterium]|nr:trypsin-like peptidase domain-containing protein [Frankiaceae bacterium]